MAEDSGVLECRGVEAKRKAERQGGRKEGSAILNNAVAYAMFLWGGKYVPFYIARADHHSRPV